MYHAIVRRKLVRVFMELGRGNHAYVLAGLASRFEHGLAGAHPLGGIRHSLGGMRHWLERLYRLFPGLNFTIKYLAVSGWPWDTTAMIEWHDKVTTATGDLYHNDGVHVARLRWARSSVFTPTSTPASWRRLADGWQARGLAEAAAPQIED